MNNPFDMMKQLGSMQSKLQELKNEMDKITAEGASGAGMVKVTIDGNFQVRKVQISDELFAMNDKGMLEVLITSAFNDASNHIREKMDGETRTMLSSMGMNL